MAIDNFMQQRLGKDAELALLDRRGLAFHKDFPCTALIYNSLSILIQVTGLVLGILALINYWDLETATKILGGSFAVMAGFKICSKIVVSQLVSHEDRKSTKCFNAIYIIFLVVSAILTFTHTMPPVVSGALLVIIAGLYTCASPCLIDSCIKLHRAGGVAREYDAKKA